MLKLTYEQKAKKCIEILQRIDKHLDQLDKYDPYGDMVENFEDAMSWKGVKGRRHTKRLIKMIQDDLNTRKKDKIVYQSEFYPFPKGKNR